ncbi:MAG: hypothetical protein ABIQ35_03820, partial [Verrucomicrobiota bacterium]
PPLIIPSNLEENLLHGIRLPQAGSAETFPMAIGFAWKRWLPAMICLAFALTVVAVQFNSIVRLKKQNAELQAATQNLEQLRRYNLEFKKQVIAVEELDQLRRDVAELAGLRAEIARLRAETSGLENLRAENKNLAASVGASAKANEDFSAEAKARAERIQCVNNLKQIGLAGRIWASDHNDVYPTDFISMENEMGTPKIMKCPSDQARAELTWADVASGNVSYKLYGPGIKGTEPQVVLAECPIHHNYCLADGSVNMLSEEQVKKDLIIIDGKLTRQSR